MGDIPLSKMEKMRPFITKHCQQGGALPKADTLRSLYVPRLFEIHFEALKKVLRGAKVCVIADETTDIQDCSILNVIVGARGKYFLIDVCTMEACNHATLSQAVVKPLTNVEVQFDDVIAVVTDSAAYCKKAPEKFFSHYCQEVFMCHVWLISLIWVLKHFSITQNSARVDTFVKMVKSSFFNKPARENRYLKFVRGYLPADQCKLPAVPVSMRWNSWYNSVKYHSEHLHVY